MAPGGPDCGADCKGCSNHTLRQPWRDDGRCGEDVRGKDGTDPAWCNPLDPRNMTCCSDVGWCGNSTQHCDCGKDCINYSFACTCADPASPCQDPHSGVCLPRTAKHDEDEAAAKQQPEHRTVGGAGTPTHDSLGRPMDVQNLARLQDRLPANDPRKSMRQARAEALAGIDRRRMSAHSARRDGSTALAAAIAAQRPLIDDLRCARG